MLSDLLHDLRRRVPPLEREAEQWLLLSAAHLNAGPWRYVVEADIPGEVSFDDSLVLAREMLARLQKLSWDPDSRAAISNAFRRRNMIRPARPPQPD